MRNKEALPCVRRYSWCVRAVSGGNVSFAKYRGPSGGSQLSGGGIIILSIQSTADGCHSLTMLTRPRREHHGGGRRRRLGRGRWGAGEDAAVEARAERSTRVRWFGCGVRLPSPQGLASGGNSRGGEASAAAHPATGSRSMRHDHRCFGRLEQKKTRG